MILILSTRGGRFWSRCVNSRKELTFDSFTNHKHPLLRLPERVIIRAAVVIPPIEDFYSTPHRLTGLGALVVQRIIEREGHSGRFYNFPLTRTHMLPLPAHLDYLTPYMVSHEQGPTAFFTSYKRFGGAYDTAAAEILTSSPDIIFISCFAFCYADNALAFASACGEAAPDVPVAVGGSGPSAFPGYFMQEESIDFVFTGEAEISLPRFLGRFERGCTDYSGIPNLLSRDGACINRETEPDEILFAGRLTDRKRKRLFSTTLTRGCTRRCSFCSIRLCHGDRLRVIPPETIKKEISLLPSDKPLLVNFEDDNLLLVPDYFFSVLGFFNAHSPDTRFIAENGLDYSLLTPEILKELKHAGFEKLNLTLGSLDPEVLNPEKRSVDRSRFESVIETAAGYGFQIITYVIAGLTHDTPEAAVDTLSFLYRLPTKVGLSLFYPVPGITGFEERDIFLLCPSTLTAGSSAYPWNNSLSTKELITLFRLSRTINFLKTDPGPAHRKDRELRKIILDTKTLYSYRKMNKNTQLYQVEQAAPRVVDYFFQAAGSSDPRHLPVQR